MKVPEFTNVDNLSEDARSAIYELIAEMLRQKSDVLNIRVADVKYDGQPIGNFEFSIRRTDE